MPTPREAYTNGVERQGFSGARLRPADFGSAGETIGRAVQGFGEAIGQVGKTVEEIQKHDAEVAAQEADNIRLARRLKRYYGDPEEGSLGFFNREGKDAVVDAQTLASDLDAIDREVADMLKGKPRAQRLFQEMTSKRNNDDMPKVSAFVSQQRNKYDDAVDADAFDLAIDNATNAEDPKIIEENIATAGNIAVRQMLRKGLTDRTSLANARQAGVGKAVASVAAKLELKSPGEAQQFVVLHAKDMDPQDVGELLKQLAPNAAKERAGEKIHNFLVTTSIGAQAASAPADEAKALPTLAPDDAALEAAQISQESGGQHMVGGKLITSSAGARGITQVMPKTGVDPGYGITPLRNNSREEYIRFRRDYMAAMKKEFGGNIVLALTAYNWGPGNVEDHIKKVGDPRKGQISDAAFLNSIPVKEAREYATLILDRVGIAPSGKGANPAAQSPTYQGEEINLAATFAKIDASDNTFIEKEALKSEASRIHSLGRQAKAEAEDRLKEAVAAHLNTLPPDGFTRFEQLPLNLRQQLATNPTLEQAYRSQAQTNEENRMRKIEARNAEARTEKSQRAELDMASLQFEDPEAFLRMDFRTQVPELEHTDRLRLMAAQASLRDSRAGKTGSVDADKMRTAVNRFVGKGKAFKTLDAGRSAKAYQKALELAQAQIKANGGKALTDAEIDGIAMSVMMPVQAGGVTRPRFEGGGQVNKFDEARRILLMRTGRYPSQSEIDAEVEAMQRLGYQ
jgi:hypothetical protein